MIVAGALGGMAWAAIPAFLRTRFNASEILTSLMLTYVAQLILIYLVTGPWRDPEGYGFPQSRLFSDAATMPILVAGTRLHLGIPIAVAVVLLAWGLLGKSLVGFQLKVAGQAPRAARYAGFSDKRLIWLSMMLGGGLAGAAGLFEVAGPVGQLTPQISPGLRLHRHHRRLPRPAASGRRALRRAAARPLLSRRRGGPDRSRPAQRRHRHLPGHPAVLPAGLRHPDPLPDSPRPPRPLGSGAVMTGMGWFVPVILSVISASTPLLLAATGELVAEKSGVLNLGIEGMMLVGAIVGFAVTLTTGSAVLGIAAAAAAGMGMALIFGVLVLLLLANQVAAGLALTIFGTGLSALIGKSFVGNAVPPLPKLDLPILSDLPVIGPILFHQDALVYGSFLLLALVELVPLPHPPRAGAARRRRFP